MIRHDVHDDLQILLVGLLHIFLEKVIVTETSIDMVIVCTCITVVSGLFKIVLDERCTPDGCRTKLADIIEMVYDTLDVTAMTSERLAAVSLVRHALHRVIRRISVCEAVVKLVRSAEPSLRSAIS